MNIGNLNYRVNIRFLWPRYQGHRLSDTFTNTVVRRIPEFISRFADICTEKCRTSPANENHVHRRLSISVHHAVFRQRSFSELNRISAISGDRRPPRCKPSFFASLISRFAARMFSLNRISQLKQKIHGWFAIALMNTSSPAHHGRLST